MFRCRGEGLGWEPAVCHKPSTKQQVKNSQCSDSVGSGSDPGAQRRKGETEAFRGGPASRLKWDSVSPSKHPMFYPLYKHSR